MAREAKPIPAALGFRVKSGWAMAVLLAGSAEEPYLVICREILLSDPKFPQSRQPFHAVLELPEKEGQAVTQKLTKVVRGAAADSVKQLLMEASAAQYEIRGAGLVVGSLVDPATLHNEHIRAHGLEGQLFRQALEDSLQAQKIPCAAWLEKSAYEAAASAVRKTPARAKRAIANLGESYDGSWRAEEKLAALAAWAALGQHRKYVSAGK
jgi:hypothetical protein